MAGTEAEPDDLRGDVLAAITELETGAPPEREAPVVETPEVVGETPPADGRARDESGRFKAKEEGTARPTLTLNKPLVEEVAPKPAFEEAKTDDGKPILKTGNDGKITPSLAAPADWMGDAKVRWGRLDRSIQEEILKREEVRTAALAEIAPLKELFDTNREFLVNQAGSVVEAQRQMMQFARMSVDNPVQLAEHILRARGLDPRAVFSGQPGQVPAQNQSQDPQAILAQLVQQELQPIRAQFERQQTQQLQSQIDAFAAREDRPYFNDVKAHMGQLLESRQAQTMDEAYEMATWANSAIRESLLEGQREAAAKVKAAETAQARNASRASLRGSPLPGASNGGTGPGASVHDDVRAAFAEASGA